MTYKLYDVRGFKIWLDIEESGMMRSRAKEQYEAEKFKFLDRVLTPEHTFVDVGANKGDFALFASVVKKCKLTVVFEPYFDNMEWIQKSFDKNPEAEQHLLVPNMAVMDTDERTKLWIGKKSGHHSIIKSHGKYIAVAGITLDTFFMMDENEYEKDRKFAIKIDVEGAELNVLLGAEKVLEHTDILTIDLDNRQTVPEVEDFVRSAGFEFTRNGKELYAIKEKK